MSRVSLDELRRVAAAALENAGVSAASATATATALVAADADGLASHGVSRVPFYADQAASGKVNGGVEPQLSSPRPGLIRVDACDGLAFPAIRLGLDAALERLGDTGVVAVAIAHSHHFGAAGYHVERAASAGAVVLGFSNSPAAMAPWGGSSASFGTNPIAFACPRQDRPPLVIDLSLSQVARGKLMVAAKRGEAIPEGWAIDAQGRPTRDPQAGLAGSMLPLGGAKGAALALAVEVLSAALSGSNFAFQASSFFTAEGAPPRIGQLFILLDADGFDAGFGQRLELLLNHILDQPGTRLPGDRRLQNRAAAERDGVDIPSDLLAELRRRAGKAESS